MRLPSYRATREHTLRVRGKVWVIKILCEGEFFLSFIEDKIISTFTYIYMNYA